MNSYERIQSPEGYCCPECDQDLSGHLEDLMAEPYNGDYIECDCGAEISVSIQLRLYVTPKQED